MRPARVLALCFVGMLALSACRVDARVDIRVREDGSGTVRVRVVLDPETVRAAETGGSTLDARVRLDDLPTAGWKLRPWARRTDGSAVLVMRRPFSSPQQLSAVMADLNGALGPLRAVRLQREPDPLQTRFTFRALADLAAVESGVASDEQLAANLSAQRVDVAGLDAALTAQIREALRLDVAVGLPDADTRVWHVAPGTRRVLATSSSVLDIGRIAWLGAGLVLGATAIAVVFFGERRSRRRRAERAQGAARADP